MILMLAHETGGPIGGVVAAGGQPMMLRATTVPGMRQWHPRFVFGFFFLALLLVA